MKKRAGKGKLRKEDAVGNYENGEKKENDIKCKKRKSRRRKRRK
jgi:hypothetical protein